MSYDKSSFDILISSLAKLHSDNWLFITGKWKIPCAYTAKPRNLYHMNSIVKKNYFLNQIDKQIQHIYSLSFEELQFKLMGKIRTWTGICFQEGYLDLCRQFNQDSPSCRAPGDPRFKSRSRLEFSLQFKISSVIRLNYVYVFLLREL